MYRPASSLTLKQRVVALHYPLYVSLIAIIGAILGVRLLSEYTWRESAVYGTTLVLSFWLGQVIVGLTSRRQNRDQA